VCAPASKLVNTACVLAVAAGKSPAVDPEAVALVYRSCLAVPVATEPSTYTVKVPAAGVVPPIAGGVVRAWVMAATGTLPVICAPGRPVRPAPLPENWLVAVMVVPVMAAGVVPPIAGGVESATERVPTGTFPTSSAAGRLLSDAADPVAEPVPPFATPTTPESEMFGVEPPLELSGSEAVTDVTPIEPEEDPYSSARGIGFSLAV